MKRSKILGGIGVLMLAGFGALASANTFAPNTYWYKPTPVSACISTVVNFDCTPSTLATCVGPVNAPSDGHTLFQTDDCDIPMRKL